MISRCPQDLGKNMWMFFENMRMFFKNVLMFFVEHADVFFVELMITKVFLHKDTKK